MIGKGRDTISSMDRKENVSLLIVDHFDACICVTALLSIYFLFLSFSPSLFIMTKDKNDDKEGRDREK
jgi:hypothetical protein